MAYPDELRERAVRMVLDHGHEYGSQWEAICSVADKLGPKAETVRLWVRRAETDTGRRPGATAEELVELKRLRRENAELRRANDLVGRGSFFRGGTRPPKEVAAFVAAHRHHGVVPICRVLSTAEHQIAPSAVRSAMWRPVCARRLAADAIKPKLLEVFNSNYRVYGRRKMKAALRREHGIVLDKDRIARLMRELGIRGATRTKTTITTSSDRSSPRAPDLVNMLRAARFAELTRARRRSDRALLLSSSFLW